MLYLVDFDGDYEIIDADNFNELFQEMEERFDCLPPYEYQIYALKEIGTLSFEIAKVFKPYVERE